jgi:TRAP-type transport system periplasmic protein
LSVLSAAGASFMVRALAAADYNFTRYHNQAPSGTLHKNLTAMWEAVSYRSNGRVSVSVHAKNKKLQGGHLSALKMLT